MQIKRHPGNPIVTAGKYDWRAVATFNPGVALSDKGKFYLYERACSSLRPFMCSIGLLESEDGINFTHLRDKPILTGEMLGFPQGTVQDARVVKIDGVYYMAYALEPYPIDCWPNGIGAPEYYAEHYREWRKNGIEPRTTRSGIVKSENGIDFEPVCTTTELDIDDRDNTLFPEKIGGKYALLRRPLPQPGQHQHFNPPGIWISFSEDMKNWEEPRFVAAGKEDWEGKKIGAATSPVKTDKGWLQLYHGVDKNTVYRLGVMMLDLEDPTKVIARDPNFIMEPEHYYEKVGLVIPNVIFPTDNVVKDGTLYIYYGCCDTSIGVATVELAEIADHVMNYSC